jgi:hypothetical protein
LFDAVETAKDGAAPLRISIQNAHDLRVEAAALARAD